MQIITKVTFGLVICCSLVVNFVTDAVMNTSKPSKIPWADAAYQFIKTQNCKEVFVMTVKECRIITKIDKSRMNVYIAEPSVHGKLETVLPDGGLGRAGRHHAVLVLDPYPEANFGHLVIVFFVDIDTTKTVCEVDGGTYLGNGECLSLALKKRCRNALMRRGKRRNFARRCEINFLPTVFHPSDGLNRKQLLRCSNDVSGFAKCPELRPETETSKIICNPLRDNTKRCETTQETIKTSCRMFEICDQAVILSGGWNRQIGLPRHKSNVVNMFNMLRKHGFKQKNIKVFYANGATKLPETDDDLPIHPSAMKLAMRYHIKKICDTPHCADSLVIYLNNPGRSDGTSLLWDANGDGIAEENERYSVEELLSDLAYCSARQVHLIVDQSYSGEIARAVEDSEFHHNVIVFASGRDNEYSWGSDFTQHWVNSDHTHKCSRNVHSASKENVRFSRPAVGESLSNHVNTTIFGAPCDVTPRFSARELRQQYLGCQNLPTALWFAKFVDGKNKPTSDINKHLSN